MLKNLEFKTSMLIAHILIALAIIVNLMLVTRFSKNVLGINDVMFSVFTDSALEILFIAFVFMPSLVVQTKIIPKNVEATVYSIFTSMSNLARGFISPLFGGVIAGLFKVTNDNFQNLKWLLLIELACNIVPLCLLWMLPTNKELDDFSKSQNSKDKEDMDLENQDQMNLIAEIDDDQSSTSTRNGAVRFRIGEQLDLC